MRSVLLSLLVIGMAATAVAEEMTIRVSESDFVHIDGEDADEMSMASASVLVETADADDAAVAEVKGDAVSKDLSRESMGLQSLIEEALRSNGELQAARQDAEQKEGESHYERRGYFPKLAAYSTYDSQPDEDSDGGQTQRTWRRAYGLQAEQLLFDWGETRGRVLKEKYTAESYKQKGRLKESEIAHEVRVSYWRVVMMQSIVADRKASVKARANEVKSVGDRVKANNARQTDLLAAEARQAQSEQDLLTAENALDLAKRRLLYYVGRDVDGTIEIQDKLLVDAKVSNEPVDVESHPDMRRVRAGEEAARAAERAAKAGQRPHLVLRGNVEDSTPEPGAGAGSLAPDGYNYQVGLYLKLPIGYQWVGAAGKLKEARGKLAQLEEEAKALKGSIKLKVMKARNELSEMIKGYEVAQKQLAAAQSKLDLMKQLVKARNATQGDVAVAEDEAARAQAGLYAAAFDIKAAESNLLREMGRIE